MIALGCDHGGFDMKQIVIEYLEEKGIEYKDFGCLDKSSCDYPEFGRAAAMAVANGECEKGIVICTTGIGISISANKVAGVRCALCADSVSAKMTRLHNNANMLAMGAGIVGTNLAIEIVDTFLNTDFSSFPGAVVNPNKQNDGMIYMNYSNPSELLDFSKPKEIGKLQFEVIAEGESNIEYYIQYIFDYDMVNIYDYTITYSLSVDGAEKIADKTPLLADINEVLKSVDDSVKFDVGDFENNVEGTGSGIKPTTAPKTNAPAADSGNNSGGGNNTTLFVIGGIVVLALIAVVIITVAKRKNTENE